MAGKTKGANSLGAQREDPSSDRSSDPGSDPCSDPGLNPGSDPGSDPSSDPGFILSLSRIWPFLFLRLNYFFRTANSNCSRR